MRTIEATPLPKAPAAIPAGHGWRLTTALVLPAAAWALDLEVGLALLPWVCRTGHRAALLALSAASFAACVAAAVLAWRLRRGLDGAVDETSDTPAARSAFLAAGAVALAVLFSLVIAATAMPRLVLPPCD